MSRAWWLTPVIPAPGRLRQQDQCEFKTSLGYKSELKASLNYCIMKPSLKKTKNLARYKEDNDSKQPIYLSNTNVNRLNTIIKRHRLMD